MHLNLYIYNFYKCVLDGYNTTIFAYGQTGCGKSYTMQGTLVPLIQKGLTSHGIEHIFEAISVSENTKYLVLASYLEIYNEEVHDLLGLDVKQKLEVKENADTGVCVPGNRNRLSDCFFCVFNASITIAFLLIE